MGRTQLSEEAEREEEEGRERFHAAETKLRELGSRRQLLLDQVHQLSDLQKSLYDRRQPKQQQLDDLHNAHREVGHQLSEARRRRDALRAGIEQALIDVRMVRQELPKGDHARPEQLRREMAQLELRQQTHAVPLAEENALIGHLRALRKQLLVAEKEQGVVEAHEARRKAADETLKQRRLELDHLSAEVQRLHVERDRKMEAMRSVLLEVGQLVAEIREKGRQRAEVMTRLDTANRQFMEVDRECGELIEASRRRRQEARQTMGEYNRAVRSSVSGQSVVDRTAEAQLAELLKRGRVTLSG
ncbi:MAG: hypothetical protein L3K19_01195 [Thermoplasmata archaeon]|nr:hypothetical protein [Thermoplasmata archaeon]